MEDYTPEYGGRMVFYTAPVTGDTVIVFRKTPITQQLDLEDGQAFPVDDVENACDKDTRILQELKVSGQGSGTAVDLNAVPSEDRVTIENSAGTDAAILPWTQDGLSAGVSMGEVVEAGGSAPMDGDPSDKPDGYIWYVLEALP